jgi:hypothetical protein
VLDWLADDEHGLPALAAYAIGALAFGAIVFGIVTDLPLLGGAVRGHLARRARAGSRR